MKFTLSKVLLLLLLGTGALAQDGFDLSDALDDPDPEPTKQQPKPTKKPKSGGELDLSDAFGPDLTPTKKPKKPSSGDSGGFGFSLEDAVGPDSKTDRPAVKPPKNGGGGRALDDSDLFDVSQGDYKPDGGRSGGRAMDPDSNPHGGAGQPEGGSGPIAGIISAVGVALVGAASSYIAYQKKKLCFKMQGGVDPESGKGHQNTRSDPQVFSTLLQNS